MKRLILLLWMMLGASAFGINITNYPATNAFDGSMTFLLSKASAFTNFNIQADLIASTNWAIATFDPSGSASAATNGYPWTNIVVQEAVHATNADNALNATNFFGVLNATNLPNGVLTNNWSGDAIYLTNDLTLSGAASDLTVGGAFSAATNITLGNPNLSTANIKLEAGSANTLVVTNGRVGIGKSNPGTALEVVGSIWSQGFNAGSSSYYLSLNNEYMRSDSAGRFEISAGGTAPFLYLSSAAAGTSIFPGVLTATNGVNLMVKPSFTTNFTCTTNLQTYLCNGTNQIVTLPNAAYVPNVIYRFTSTNGYGSYIVTNATGSQTIRDGVSLSHKQIGIAPFDVFSDGAQWWLAARDQSVEPNAQFSCSTNIPLTSANTAYPVTFNSTDFNNSQGIALGLGTNGTHFSKMWITNSGQYEFTPSIVIGMGNVSHTVRYWFRSNDTNIPASTTPTKVAGNDVVVVTVPFVVNITTPTAIEIWAESDGTGDSLTAASASGNYPASPSVICPVKRISDTWP